MNFGWIKVAAASPEIKTGNCAYNAVKIIEKIKEAADEKAKILVLPEMCITGASIGDLAGHDAVLNSSLQALKDIVKETKNKEMLVFVGLPIRYKGKIYSVAAAIFDGELKAFIPKPDVCDFGEIDFEGDIIPFGATEFIIAGMFDANIAVEIGTEYKNHGAAIIAKMTAEMQTVTSEYKRFTKTIAFSDEYACAYISANAGIGESTSEGVYSGLVSVFEDGEILNEFMDGIVFSEIDVAALSYVRTKKGIKAPENESLSIEIDIKRAETELTRYYDSAPLCPAAPAEVLDMQARGIKKRIESIGAKKVVIGLSGGLDSTLTLLAAERAVKYLSRPASDIVCVTMPCFGTTQKTLNNARSLAKAAGAVLKKIDITASVKQHFKDIGQDINNRDVTFENAQARVRTLILMDIANQNGGLVLGTGDLSELALGWTTYGGDHMSMYNPNAGIAKTAVRGIVEEVASSTDNLPLAKVLMRVLQTPVSPELLPPSDGVIQQRTEDIIGPYILHDFFLYHFVSKGCTKEKLFKLVKYVFEDLYDDAEIERWLNTFFRRFFDQQFKRSCSPEGPRIGSVSLSPRSGFKIPSDLQL